MVSPFMTSAPGTAPHVTMHAAFMVFYFLCTFAIIIVVLFEDVAMTRMFCEGVDDWLSGLTAGTIAGTTMTVLGQDGSEIGQLERTSDTPEAD